MVCGLHYFLVPHRAAGLDDGPHAGLRRLVHAVAEGEERARAEDGAGRLVAGGARLVHGEEGGVHPGHLPGTYADGGATARQANSRSSRSSSEGARCVTTFHASAPVTAGARSCASRPPRTRLRSSARPPSHRATPSSTRRFFFRPSTSTASAVKLGATMHSTKRLEMASAAASSTGTVKAITDPNADTGSQASAFR